MPGPPPPHPGAESTSDADLVDFARLESLCFDDPWPIETLKDLFDQPDFLFMKRSSTDPPDRLTSTALFRTNSAAGEAELLRICSDPAGRRLGHARGLLVTARTVLEELQIEDLYLEVRENNLPALHLYDGLGFQRLGVRSSYYPDGTDALTLVWRLDPPSPTRSPR